MGRGSLKRAAKSILAAMGLLEIAYRLKWRIRQLPAYWRNARIRRRGSDDGLPIPPLRLIVIVAGSYDIPWFLRGGKLATETIRDVLGKNGVSLDSFGKILDFGCGCGRVIRHWRERKGIEIHGSDYNPRLIDWCQRNLPFATFGRNDLTPPTWYEDGQFDLIYALSVFTHLSEDVQRQWMAEWARILRPGGYLLVTLHGASYIDELTPDERTRFEAGQIVVKRPDAPGTNLCSAYHPERYVREKLVRGFEIIDVLPEAARGNPHQDVYLLRKPA